MERNEQNGARISAAVTPSPSEGTSDKAPDAKVEAAKPGAGKPTEAAAKASEPKVTAKRIEPLSFVTVPAKPLLAAALCAAAPSSGRSNLTGVHLHRKGSTLRVVATDGARLLVITVEPEEDKLPAWLDDGVTIPAEGLKAKLGMLEDEVRIWYAANAPRIELSDSTGSALFRLNATDLAFPAYERILGDAGESLVNAEGSDFASVALSADAYKGVAGVAKALGVEEVRLYTGGGNLTTPRVITFPKFPGALMYQMPMKLAPVPIAAETRALLSPAIKGSIAALRAHVTRNREAAKSAASAAERQAAEARAVSFEQRIEAALRMERTGLPAPKEEPAKAPATPAAKPAAPASASGAMKALPAPATPAKPEPPKATVPAKVKPARRLPLTSRAKMGRTKRKAA